MNGMNDLIALKQEHPELPVITLVDSEVVAEDGYRWWLGEVTSSWIDYYYIGEERVFLKEWDDIDDIMYLDEDVTEEEADRMFEELPWTKAIIAYIGVKESEPHA